jgi:hypothetical protein
LTVATDALGSDRLRISDVHVVVYPSNPTISSIDQTLSEIPASIAGVTRIV